jgi:hypothetical protein
LQWRVIIVGVLGIASAMPPGAVAGESATPAPSAIPTAPRAAEEPKMGPAPIATTAGSSTEKTSGSSTEKKRAGHPRWSWSAWISGAGGYDSNISKSTYAKSGTPQGSGTTTLSGSIGPSLQILDTLSADLSYSLDHLLYYSNHDLDTQTHALSLALRHEGERFWLSGSYALSVSVLLPKNVFYSLDHDLGISSEILIKGPLWAGAKYRFEFADVRDASYAYLRGQSHTGKV